MNLLEAYISNKITEQLSFGTHKIISDCYRKSKVKKIIFSNKQAYFASIHKYMYVKQSEVNSPNFIINKTPPPTICTFLPFYT
jgi:hypothetical protein